MPSRRTLVPFIALLVILAAATYWLYGNQTKPTTIQLTYTVLAENLDTPWSLALTPEGDLIFTERVGNVKLLSNGNVQTIYTLQVHQHQNQESGLLGIALSPNYSKGHHVYLYYTYEEPNGAIWNRVSYYIYTGTTLSNETIILDHIPAANLHDGGRIKFGPDRKLYVTTGETGQGTLAQDLGSLAGKILRLNPDGSIPDDNPFQGSPVYSLGHRNPEGLAWNPVNGQLYETEHGPSGESLQFAHDEINFIESGANYGWPIVVGYSDNSEYVNPLYQTGGETWAPSGATFLNDPPSTTQNRLFVACLRGTGIRIITFTPPDYTAIQNITSIFIEVGRVRTIIQGPNDYLYFCTSNRDGRGTPKEGDDIIAMFKPPK